MATTYLRLFDPTQQFQLKSGAINTAGLLRVYLNGTDDLADIYDENGTQLAQPAVLDNNGRARGLFVDSKKTYRLEVYDQFDSLLFTVRNMSPCGGGGGSSLGSQYDLVSTDGSVSIDRSVDAGRTTFDLSADKGSPEVIVTSSAERTTDGAFSFSSPSSHSGTKLTVDDGTVISNKQFIHFEATVRLVWSGQQNADADIQFRCMDTVESLRFNLSFPHTEYLDVSADYEVMNDGTPIPVTVSGLPTGLSATVENFSVHSISRRYGEGGEYRAGNGILIQTGEISIDPTVVQEKLTAGTNIEIVGNTINATAAPQQQADWAVTDTSSPQYILNKPELARVATSGSYDDLTDKPQIPAAQVNSDWNSNSGVSRILNKPDLSVYARSSDLATVATSGSYDDLSDKPAIPAPQVNADWNSNSGVTKILNKPDLGVFARSADLAEVATTGDYDDLRNKPSIPAAQVNADWDSNSGVSQILNKPNLATVATTGNYNDLSGRPSIPAAQVNADWNASSGVAEILNKPTLFSGDYDDLTDKPDLSVYAEKSELAPVATSGSYDDLTDKPSIPSFTQTQQAAIDSGINSTKVGAYDTHVADTAIHVTAADKTAWNGKEDAANKKQSLDPASTTDFPSSKAAADFVNSSIATQTAKFLGNLTLTDLGLTYPATNVQIAAALNSHTWPVGVTVTNNDYVYVEIQNPQTTSVDDRVERYKYSDGLASWGYEYTLNNSSFTAAEIAAIDSGITAADKSAYDAHVADGTIHVTAADKTAWNGKQDAISDLSTIRSGAAAGATAVQPGDLATVATTGNYSDLNGKPTLFSGDYDDLTDKPDLSVYAESADLAAVATSGAYADLSGKPDLSVYAESADLATVATTGSYDDLSDKPTIPAAQVNADWNAASGVAQILNKPTLAAVATSGAYADLSGTPTINNVPAVTSSDDNKVLKASYSGGVGSYSWEQAPASQVQSDWTEADPSAASYIENKPVPKALVAGQGISISESSNALTITNTAAAASVTDVQVDGASVVTNGVANITTPTVDQTYDASSTNAQSGVAVADAIGNLPTNLSAAQLLALKQALGVDETVLWSDTPVYAHGAGAWNPSITLSETVANFDSIKCYLGRMIGGEKCDEVIEVPVINGEAHHRIPAWPEGSVSGNWFLGGIDFVGASGSQWGSYNDSGQTQTKYLPNGWFPGGFWKVVGINRIASN